MCGDRCHNRYVRAAAAAHERGENATLSRSSASGSRSEEQSPSKEQRGLAADRDRDGEAGRRGDGETGRRGDGETGTMSACEHRSASIDADTLGRAWPTASHAGRGGAALGPLGNERTTPESRNQAYAKNTKKQSMSTCATTRPPPGTAPAPAPRVCVSAAGLAFAVADFVCSRFSLLLTLPITASRDLSP